MESSLDVNSDVNVQYLWKKYSNTKISLNGWNSQLWLMYLDMIDKLCTFIKGVRIGDWKLHLQSMANMLPFLASSGHFNFVKSIILYLQKMNELETTHSLIHQRFLNGYHVIRRTDRDWVGLSSDLVIEQELMRSLKTTGGLARGGLRGGFNEAQRQQWILSMPAYAGMNRAMQHLTGVQYHTSDQHQMGVSRQRRDTEDTLKLISFLTERNPFEDGNLRNIATGEVADEKVNVDQAQGMGDAIL